MNSFDGTSHNIPSVHYSMGNLHFGSDAPYITKRPANYLPISKNKEMYILLLTLHFVESSISQVSVDQNLWSSDAPHHDLDA